MSNRCAVYVRVSTDDQRYNGYSIDSQLRMIKEYCEKGDYLIVDVYNDAGHSGKDLMRPEMQRLLKDIKFKKIDKLVAIKVDRLTRNNYDGFWLLNHCEQHDVKIELILEPYDVSTANGEMIFGMNLVFGQRERKGIGTRTKRSMEEMTLSKIHPSKVPYGYIRNKETGYLEIEPIEAQVVKEIFELCKKGHSTRNIASLEITRDKNYNIEIKNIKFTDEFISESNKEYLNYLNKILNNNEIGIKYKEQIDKQKLEKLEQDYFIFSTKKYEDNKYLETDLLLYMELIKQHFYQDGIINCPYIEDNNIVDNLLLIPKTINHIEWAKLMNNYKNTAEEIILKEYIFI